MSELDPAGTTGAEGQAAPTEQAAPTAVVIKATNPTAEEMATLCENIKVNHDFDVNVKPVKFNFKKQVDKATKIETLREAVELALPFPSVQGILSILEATDGDGGNKQLELLVDAIESVITAQARDIIADDTGITAANFPLDKVTWQFIANMPKAQRRGGGIPKEVWEGFAQDYVEVMPEATGKKVEQVTNAAAILKDKLTKVKTNTDVLNLLVEQLAIYAENTPNMEEYAECVTFLLNKAETFLNISPEELLQGL
jgi:hypothetical protein